MKSTLHGRFADTAATDPERLAVIDPARGESLTYGQLSRRVRILESDLERSGVGRGDRIGVCHPKSIGSLAAILATLERGAVYVPVDPSSPTPRIVDILTDCAVSAVFVERDEAEDLKRDLPISSSVRDVPSEVGSERWARDLALLECEGEGSSPLDDLAYILYTSGSTGKPKGVMHTHASALSFVDWCVKVFEPTPEDRFSSHAPFHFDLSILDLYVPLSTGAAVVLIGEEDGKSPLSLAPLISEAGISVWYSTPSVLRLLIEYGRLADHDAERLRLVLFAGEVFAPGHLRRLQAAWPGRRYFNLYGPTETNVCTYYEIAGEVPADRVDPYPIGEPIDGDEIRVVDEDGEIVDRGLDGELLVHGGTVMAGYWNRPELNARAFHEDSRGRKWYRTGDIVRQNEAGECIFLGRRDRMIKRRGYRVELGEIETALYRHPHVREAAVVAISPETGDCRVRAFLSWDDSDRPSTIELKQFCASNLPLYMIPDDFEFLDEIPKTSTDKIDYMQMKSSG